MYVVVCCPYCFGCCCILENNMLYRCFVCKPAFAQMQRAATRMSESPGFSFQGHMSMVIQLSLLLCGCCCWCVVINCRHDHIRTALQLTLQLERRDIVDGTFCKPSAQNPAVEGFGIHDSKIQTRPVKATLWKALLRAPQQVPLILIYKLAKNRHQTKMSNNRCRQWVWL